MAHPLSAVIWHQQSAEFEPKPPTAKPQETEIRNKPIIFNLSVVPWSSVRLTYCSYIFQLRRDDLDPKTSGKQMDVLFNYSMMKDSYPCWGYVYLFLQKKGWCKCWQWLVLVLTTRNPYLKRNGPLAPFGIHFVRCPHAPQGKALWQTWAHPMWPWQKLQTYQHLL